MPWLLFMALLVWGALLWIFGFLLEQLDTQPQIPTSVDAQFMEVRSSGRQHEGSKPVPKLHPPTIVPPSAEKAVTPTQQQSDVSQSAVTNNDAGLSSQSDTVSNAPPQFGAAYLNNPKPAYPHVAKQMRMEGTVLLKVFVSHEGTVLNLEIAHSSGYEILDKTAAEAVRKWRFIPASRAFQPIDEWVQVPVTFRLNK